MTHNLCPVCFTRFITYDEEGELWNHIKTHSKKDIQKAKDEIEWYSGYLDACLEAKDRNR